MIKYYNYQDALAKWGMDIAIKRYILQTLAEDAIDAEYSESTPVPEEPDREGTNA